MEATGKAQPKIRGQACEMQEKAGQLRAVASKMRGRLHTEPELPMRSRKPEGVGVQGYGEPMATRIAFNQPAMADNAHPEGCRQQQDLQHALRQFEQREI